MSKELDKKRSGANVEKVIIDEFVPSKAIDNANPSEALNCLKSLDIQTRFMGILDVPSWEKYLPIIKQALLKAQEQEKILSIIKEKNIDILAIKESKTLEEYNRNAWEVERYGKYKGFKLQLTQEEFDLLKRYFGNE